MFVIIVKIVLGLVAAWFGFLTLLRGVQYFGLLGSEAGWDSVVPSIKLEFPFKDFLIDLTSTVILITLICII